MLLLAAHLLVTPCRHHATPISMAEALEALPRRELQALAKQSGLRANQKSSVLIAQLSGRNGGVWPPAGVAGAPVDLPAAEDEDLRLLSRRELQEVAKRRGVRANAKSSEIISALESLRHADRAAPEPDPAPAPPEAAAPVEAADVGLDLVERARPAVLTPAPCAGGRWQPIRLRGPSLELTLLVRDVGTPVGRLDVPPLSIVGERLGGAEVEAEVLPALELGEEEVALAAGWASTLTGLLGIDEPGLFPAPAQMLHADGVSSGSAGGAGEAAVLFWPQTEVGGGAGAAGERRALDALRDPAQWERLTADPGAAEPRATELGTAELGTAEPGDAAAWPEDGEGEPVVVLEHRRPEWVALTPTLRLSRGVAGLARVNPDRNEQSGVGEKTHRNPKNALQEAAYRRGLPPPSYASEQLSEQVWAATLSLEGYGHFRGEPAPRKRLAEMAAARLGLRAVEEGAEPPAAAAEEEPAVLPPGGVGSPKARLGRLATRAGGYVAYSVEHLGHQLFRATVRLAGIEAASPAAWPPAAGLDAAGEPARSKKLAAQSAATVALGEWGDQLALLCEPGADAAGEEGEGGGAVLRLALPLRASQWRGAACAVVMARVLAHAAEVRLLRADLLTLLPAASVPSCATLCGATTPRSIGGGGEGSNEMSAWVGNAVLGLCCKVAAVLALGAPPRRAQQVFSPHYYRWLGTSWLAGRVRSRGWEKALFLQPWAGESGITRGGASPETQKEVGEAVIGAVFLHSLAAHGVDRAMEDAWRLCSRVVLRGEGSVAEGWGEALAVLRPRLVARRPGPVRVWVDLLSLPWPNPHPHPHPNPTPTPRSTSSPSRGLTLTLTLTPTLTPTLGRPPLPPVAERAGPVRLGRLARVGGAVARVRR